jgi:hypothetical protein
MLHETFNIIPRCPHDILVGVDVRFGEAVSLKKIVYYVTPTRCRRLYLQHVVDMLLEMDHWDRFQHVFRVLLFRFDHTALREFTPNHLLSVLMYV